MEEVEKEYSGAELVGAGLTPNSPFYFIDEFLDSFSDDIAVKEEKFAEYLLLKEEGDEEAANKSLTKYKEYAERLEKEIDPGRREEARKSAAAIRNAVRGSEEDFQDVLDKEEKLVTAVEIAGKIKTLCENLAKLDPNAYYETCKTEDGPEWQKKLDKDLTEGQRKIAKEFVEIMKQCFETSGQECSCEKIPFLDFAEACSEAAPLATACDIGGDEEACGKLDELEMPELPPYLQEIFEEMGEGVNEAKYKMRLSSECVKEGITDPKECGKFMVTNFAPPECREALLEADVQNEWEGKKICNKIMMKLHAPECIEKGITDPRKCEEFMYGLGNRPLECEEKGIHDLKACKEFLGKGGKFDERELKMNCKEIQNSKKRLECFDKMVSGVGNQLNYFRQEQKFRVLKEKCIGECIGPNTICQPGPNGEENSECKECAKKCEGFYEGPCLTDKKWKIKEKECRKKFGDHAGSEPVMGDSGEGYECLVDLKCVNYSKERGNDLRQGLEMEDQRDILKRKWFKDYFKDRENYSESECKDGCQDECPEASRTDCINERCECFYDEREYKGDYPDQNYDEDYERSKNDSYPEPSVKDYERENYVESSKGNYSQEPSGGDYFLVDGREDASEPFPAEPTYGNSTTITGNAFLDYRF